jgi:alkanesulfonate monooxygenase
MPDLKIDGSVEVFSTCPQSADGDQKDYIQRVVNVAQWSEHYGCKGILVYSDNRLVDPWLVSHLILQHTETLCPLVAVQPLYMHPYTVAKLASSFGFLYRRRIYLNMVAGGFKNDLTALKDSTPHDRRYDRLREYTHIIKELLTGITVSYEGEFYAVSNLRLTPSLPPDLFPGVFLSGSSDAGLEACRALGATAIKYPKSPKEETECRQGPTDSGIRVGIITRDTEEEAWTIARERFPEDRKGQLTHQVAMKVSDSVWHKQLSQLAEETRTDRDPYWLIPFQNYKTFCPYLVGSHATVARELLTYIEAGYRTFILDIPPDQEELRHTATAFNQAMTEVGK